MPATLTADLLHGGLVQPQKSVANSGSAKSRKTKKARASAEDREPQIRKSTPCKASGSRDAVPDASMWADVNDSRNEILRAVRECRHEHVIISRGSIDEVIGVVRKQDCSMASRSIPSQSCSSP